MSRARVWDVRGKHETRAARAPDARYQCTRDVWMSSLSDMDVCIDIW